jgi:TRAP-type C4-dicarboxylate transport system substrate-binding protein
MKCQLFPSLQLGGTPAQLIDQVADGVVDLTITLPGYTPGRFPIMEVFELPFMTNSAESAAKAAWEFYTKYGKDEFKNFKPLFFSTHDEGYIHTRDKQVKTLTDLKGLKIRAGTRLTNLLATELGATAVGMPVTAIPDAVSKGVVDGFFLPWEIIPALKLEEMVKYHTETDPSRPALYSAIFVFAMNPAKYNSLPADLKAIIDRNSGLELSGQAGKAWDESQAAGRKSAKDRGNVFYTVPAAEVDNWIKESQPVYNAWVDSMKKLNLDGSKMLSDARDLLKKYAKK